LFNLFPLTVLFVFIFLALVLALFQKIKLIVFFVFFCLSGAVLFIFDRARLSIFAKARTMIDDYEEKINILTETIHANQKILLELPEKEKKVCFLSDLSNEFIALSRREDIYDYIINICAKLFPESANGMLFIFQKNKSALSLARSFKNQKFVIKEKYGDVIDKWVMKHNQSIAIDDLTRDFRFGYDSVTAFQERGSRCFIASPISIGERLYGIVRLESTLAGAFNVGSSRLLYSICNLAAVVMERAELFEIIEELATKDALTGLFLREYFLGRLKVEIKRARIKKSAVGLIMIDIDDFKNINDTYGHIVGDLVLKKLARVFVKTLAQPGNMACRFGGEEFLLMLVETDRQDTISVAEKIRKEVEERVISFRRKQIRFAISGGCAFYPEDSTDILDLVEKADSLLYKAKTTGKNKICF